MKRRFFALLAVPALALGFALASPGTDEAQQSAYAVSQGNGSTRSIRYSIDSVSIATVYSPLGTRAGGEVIGHDS